MLDVFNVKLCAFQRRTIFGCCLQEWSIKVTALSLAARKLGSQLGTFVEAITHFSVLCCPV
jgi:hypothetical protein